MRFCTKCGSPVSGMLRFCTRCGAATSSTAVAGVASVPTTGTADPGMVEAGRVIAAHPGSLPAIPAQADVADAESGGVPPYDTVPGEAVAPEPDQPAAAQPAAPQPAAAQPAAAQPEADQSEADEATPAALATDQPELALEYSPAPPEAALPTGVSGDAGPLGLVQIGAEPDHETWPEDPWLPGSRRPDRRALIIGVVLIAGLLSVASTAWLVRVNPPQASSPHGGHRSRPSQLGSGRAQPSQALSGQPTPILAQSSQPTPGQPQPGQLQPSRPAPTPTATGPARPSPTGHSQSGHDQSGSGHPGTSQSRTGHPGQPGASPTGTQHTGSGQSGPGQAGSGSSGTGHSGTGRGTTPAAPHPRRPAPGSRGDGAPRHPHPGIVSTAPGLAGRADARRVAGLLVRYFAAVNHRRYQAYASLFALRHRVTPRDFVWGYQTSHDSNVVLAGVAALKGGLKATVTFTSYQAPAQSPDHSSCIDWKITLFLHRTGATYLIGMPPPGYRAGLQACRFAPRYPAQGHSSQRSSRDPSSKHRGPKHRDSTHRGSTHQRWKIDR